MVDKSKKIKVGVLSGGISLEHEVSLNSGKIIRDNLNIDKYKIVNIFISKSGQWFLNKTQISPKELKENVDIIFSVLHGFYGEDGKVQSVLEENGIKFVGSSAKSSQVSFSKIASKQVFEKNNIRTPLFLYLNKDKIYDINKDAKRIFEAFKKQKMVVKASESGSSIGVYVCKSIDELIQGMKNAFKISNNVLVEEYISGREFSCGVLEKTKGNVESLPIVEIIPPKNFFNFKAKYQMKAKEICPAVIDDKDLIKEIQKTAVKIHKVLGLSDYSRTDFMFNKKKGLYALEVNTLPGMTETSLYPQELRACGIKLSSFFRCCYW